MNRIVRGRNNSYIVRGTNGAKTFIPPLLLKPLPPSKPFQSYPKHGFAAGVQGHTLPSFSWNNAKDVQEKRFPGVKIPATPLINGPSDQSNCGSCWMVSAVTMTSDRLAIATQTPPQILDILDLCCDGQDGCDGGDSALAFGIMNQNGLHLDQCNPYGKWCVPGYHCTYEGTKNGAGVGADAPVECTCKGAPSPKTPCPAIAKVDPDSFIAFYVHDNDHRIQVVQDEIFQNGPVVVGFMVTDALVSGYNCQKKNDAPFGGEGNALGGHAVCIVGWGPGYWVVRNSWGPKWNGDGYWNYQWNAGLEDSAISAPVAWTASYTGASGRVGSGSTGKGVAAITQALTYGQSHRTSVAQWIFSIGSISLLLIVFLSIFLLSRSKKKP